jgi:hypothetical protein
MLNIKSDYLMCGGGVVLTSDSERRDRVVREIYDTEKSYVASLDLLVKVKAPTHHLPNSTFVHHLLFIYYIWPFGNFLFLFLTEE